MNERNLRIFVRLEKSLQIEKCPGTASGVMFLTLEDEPGMFQRAMETIETIPKGDRIGA